MNIVSTLPLAFASLPPSVSVLAVFFAGWALVLFLVLHIDGHRAR